MTIDREAFVATMLPMYREMIATATEMQAEGRPHRAHLKYALHLLETATPAWWDSVIDGDPVSTALDQTFKMAQCDESCFCHPNNAARGLLA